MDDERIIAYLLEELTDEEIERFDEELFVSADNEIDLRAVEDELVHSYLLKELSAERQARFELNYLQTTARYERVAQAAALLRILDSQGGSSATPAPVPRPGPSPVSVNWGQRLVAAWGEWAVGLRVAAMTAVVAVIVGGLFITVFRTRSPQSYTDWTLQASNQTRGDASVPPTLKLPFAQDALRIKLVVPASARTASGLEVQLRDGNDQRSIVPIAARDAETVTVILPKSELKPGKNALALLVSRNGGPPEPLADLYYFNVE